MDKKILPRNEIFQIIISELNKSEIEILFVTNWFADEKLFDILLKKQKQGVKVNLIINNFLTNEKIRLSELTKSGGEIYKPEKGDLGITHKKYCIIDEKIAILTLFNWSTKVLPNSIESVIITEHQETIQNLKTSFLRMTNSTSRIDRKNIEGSLIIRFKNGVLNFFGIKVKEPETNEGTDLKKNTEPENKNKLELIKTERRIENELTNFFH